jgi:hypothetical protein
MGRYELVRPTVRKRLFARIFGERFRNLSLGKKLSKLFLHLVAYTFIGGYTMVTIIDPYGGAMANAFEFDYNVGGDSQTYGYATTQKISFDRSGWKIVTGDEAVAIYVANAAPPETGTIKDFAYTLVVSNDWGRDQYSCLVALWTRESNWHWNSYNRGSGAYGIPQALPGAKMAEFGSDWQTNPETQVRWGVNYIKHRYGSPCGAMAHSNKMNWY